MSKRHDNDNDGTGNGNGHNKNKGNVTSFEDFLRRRFAPKDENGTPPADNIPSEFGPLPQEDIPTSPAAVMAAARLELAAYFNFMADSNNPGLKILRGNPHFHILQAVYNDDLGKLFTTMALAKVTDLSRRWYWHFPQDPQNVSFVAPAHVVRTHTMAVAINKHNADFAAADSEGRTPLYYIAEHGRDPWLIAYIVNSLKVDPYNSGRCTNDFNLQTPNGTAYEEPFLRAIRAANAPIVTGFLSLSAPEFDSNKPRDNWDQTPLILAVQEANDAAMTLPPVTDATTRRTLARRLWIVRELAGTPEIDIAHKDIGGNTARDYAMHPDVAAAFDAGVALRAHNATALRLGTMRRQKPQP